MPINRRNFLKLLGITSVSSIVAVKLKDSKKEAIEDKEPKTDIPTSTPDPYGLRALHKDPGAWQSTGCCYEGGDYFFDGIARLQIFTDNSSSITFVPTGSGLRETVATICGYCGRTVKLFEPCPGCGNNWSYKNVKRF